MSKALRARRSRLGTLGVAVGLLATSVAGPIWNAGQVAAAPAARAAATTATVSDLGHQTLVETAVGATASIVGSAGYAANPDGLLQLTTSTDPASHAQVTLNAPEAGGTPADLAGFTQGGYDVYVASGQPVTYQLPTWCDGTVSAANDAHFVTFQYLPADNAVPTVGHITGLAADAAMWTPTRWVLTGGTTSSTAPAVPTDAVLNKGQAYPLSVVKAACPGKTTGPKLNLGSGEPSASSFIDNVVFNDTTTNFVVAKAPTVTSTIPATLGSPTAAAPATFDGTLANPTDGQDLAHVVLKFVVAPVKAESTLTATSLHIQYQDNDQAAAWHDLPLTTQDGNIVGTFGPAEGFPLPRGASNTTHFRAWVDPGVKGNNLAIAVAVYPVPGDTALAGTFVYTTLAGPQNDCPATLGTGATVRLAYGRYLGRCADPAGYALWKAMLDAGQPVTALSSGFSFSIENMMGFVDDAYQVLLGRPADAAGINGWSQRIHAGMRVDDFYAALANSPEFRSLYPTAGDKVDALYDLILDREADDAGRAGWIEALNRGTSPGQLATSLWRSTESLHLIVGGIYDQLLARVPDGAGLSGWSNILVFTGNPFYLQAKIGGSPEFVLQAQTFPPINPPAAAPS